MQGIVLAAGQATRLPNKALLPCRQQSNCGLVIEQAILFCQCVCERDDVIVVADDIVKTVLRHRGHECLRFVTQPGKYGPVDAIARGALAAKEDEDLLVTFCDNIYSGIGDDEVEFLRSGGTIRSHASTRALENCCQLDCWVRNKWKSHNDGVAGVQERFAGWLRLKYSHAVMGRPSEEMVAFLNRIEAKPQHFDVNGWYDVGTPASYLAYIQGRKMVQ